jgi:hypothetical protein
MEQMGTKSNPLKNFWCKTPYVRFHQSPFSSSGYTCGWTDRHDLLLCVNFLFFMLRRTSISEQLYDPHNNCVISCVQ